MIRLGAAELTSLASFVASLPFRCGLTSPLLLGAPDAMRGVKKNTSKANIKDRAESHGVKEQFRELVSTKRKTPGGTAKRIRECKMFGSGFQFEATYPVVALLGPLGAGAASPVDVLQ